MSDPNPAEHPVDFELDRREQEVDLDLPAARDLDLPSGVTGELIRTGRGSFRLELESDGLELGEVDPNEPGEPTALVEEVIEAILTKILEKKPSGSECKTRTETVTDGTVRTVTETHCKKT